MAYFQIGAFDNDPRRTSSRAQLRQRAEAYQQTHPVNFDLTNKWKETITADKRHHRDYQLQGLTSSDP